MPKPRVVRNSFYRIDLASRIKRFRKEELLARSDKKHVNWDVRDSTLDQISKGFEINISNQLSQIQKSAGKKTN